MIVDQYARRLARRFSPHADADLDAVPGSGLSLLARMATVAVKPRAAELQAELSSGIELRGPNRAGYGGRGPFVYRDAVEPEVVLLADLVSPGDLVIDVGSCVGLYSLSLAKLVGPTGLVIAVDPNPESMGRLIANAQRNGLSNILPVVAGASATSGHASLDDGGSDRPDSWGLGAGEKLGLSTVFTYSLDDLVARYGQGRPLSFAKIDAEGHEAAVLRGFAGAIADFSPALLIEEIKTGELQLPGFDRFRFGESRNRLFLREGDSRGAKLLAEAAVSRR